MLKILITSGATKEYIDDVRVITNISTGKLGVKIVEHILDQNYEDIDCSNINPTGEIAKAVCKPQFEVYHILSSSAAKPTGKMIEFEPSMNHETNYSCGYGSQNDKYYHPYVVDSAQNVYNLMQDLVPKVDVVIHSMAISDFTFNRDNPVKLKSNDPQGFVDYLRDNIRMNPKIISHIKEWNPKVILVGFKFEVGLTEQELIEVAQKARKSYNGDIVVANDKVMMQEAKTHVAYFCSDNGFFQVNSKEEIAKTMLKEVKKLIGIKNEM